MVGRSRQRTSSKITSGIISGPSNRRSSGGGGEFSQSAKRADAASILPDLVCERRLRRGLHLVRHDASVLTPVTLSDRSDRRMSSHGRHHCRWPFWPIAPDVRAFWHDPLRAERFQKLFKITTGTRTNTFGTIPRAVARYQHPYLHSIILHSDYASREQPVRGVESRENSLKWTKLAQRRVSRGRGDRT